MVDSMVCSRKSMVYSGRRVAVALNDAKVKAAKPRERDYKLGDTGQLYLLVTKAGGKIWKMNYSFGVNGQGKPAQKTLTFGSYPALSLGDARQERDAAKGMLLRGKDPAVERRLAAQAAAIATENTLESIGDRWFELNSGWSLELLDAHAKANGGRWNYAKPDAWQVDPRPRWSANHSYDVLTAMRRDVYPAIGGLPIASIKAPKVLAVLKTIEARGAVETAHRARQRISAIFVYGIAAGICEDDPAASIGKALKPVPKATPQPSIIDRVEHQDDRIIAVRQMIVDCEAERTRATTKLALRFMCLTAVRSTELAGARWPEFDLDGPNPSWRIPAIRMKGDHHRKADDDADHVVPLSRQAVAIMRVLRTLTGRYPYCFPSERHVHKPMSEGTLRALLIRAGYGGRHVPHGFRAAFSTIMNERPLEQRQDNDRAVIDLMLAHTPEQKSGSEGSYNRAAYMPRRRELAQEWADLVLGDFWEPEVFIGQPIRYAATGPGRLAA